LPSSVDSCVPWRLDILGRRLLGLRIAYYAPNAAPISCGVSTSVKVSGTLHALNDQEHR
jgi:hypothetical protein